MTAVAAARPNEALEIIQMLLDEISTELELHYDPEDREGLKETLASIRTGRAYLRSNGASVPESADHVVSRFCGH